MDYKFILESGCLYKVLDLYRDDTNARNNDLERIIGMYLELRLNNQVGLHETIAAEFDYDHEISDFLPRLIVVLDAAFTKGQLERAKIHFDAQYPRLEKGNILVFAEACTLGPTNIVLTLTGIR